jgi:RimJ/RimL family protein N-acetyltransferase
VVYKRRLTSDVCDSYEQNGHFSVECSMSVPFLPFVYTHENGQIFWYLGSTLFGSMIRHDYHHNQRLMNESTTLSTPRTILRPLTLSDASALHALWTTPGVRRYLWDDTVLTVEQTAEVVERSVRLHREQGFGLWGVWPREGGSLLGFVGFTYFYEPPVLELGYGIAEEQWGHGLATEVAQAMIAYGFNTLGLTDIRASLNADNIASARVLEKLGFVLEQRKHTHGVDACFYRLIRQTA